VRAVVALLFLKYLVRHIDREAARVLLEAMHREGVTREDRQYYQAFYTAFLQTKSAEEIEVFIAEAGRRQYHDSEEDLMTYAEKLETKGREEGREEGRVAGKQDVLMRLLSRKFDVSDAERETIRGMEDPDRLDAALDELVVAETKEAVLEKLK
jgi:flagellar biosynthesis/type III secretory pathway protein FliH